MPNEREKALIILWAIFMIISTCVVAVLVMGKGMEKFSVGRLLAFVAYFLLELKITDLLGEMPKHRMIREVNEKSDSIKMLADKVLSMQKDAYKLDQIEQNISSETHLTESITSLMKMCLENDVFERTLSEAYNKSINQIQVLLQKSVFDDNSIKETVATKRDIQKKKRMLIEGQGNLFDEIKRTLESLQYTQRTLSDNNILSKDPECCRKIREIVNGASKRLDLKMAEKKRYEF